MSSATVTTVGGDMQSTPFPSGAGGREQGRITLQPGARATDYARVQEAGGAGPQGVEERVLRGRMQSSPVSALYFSGRNIEALQQGLRNAVLNASCGAVRIGRQSDDELIAIMSSVFFEHSRNQPFEVVAQVRELNARVLGFAVPRIVSEVGMHRKYLQDAQSGPQLMAPGVSTSVAGTKTLEMRRFI